MNAVAKGAEIVRKVATTCLEAMDDVLFPLACQVCGLDGLPEPYCSDCRRELLEAAGACCRRCAMPVGPHFDPERRCSECRGRSLGFDRAWALGPYQGPIRDACLLVKQAEEAWLIPWLAALLVEARGEAIRESGVDRVVPVPAHWTRRMRRRHDQADELASSVARKLGLPLCRPLRRVKATTHLVGLSRTERAAELKDAFRVRRGFDCRGWRVLLVDDILTSGATCGAAARALRKAGAAKVAVAVIGRAEGRC